MQHFPKCTSVRKHLYNLHRPILSKGANLFSIAPGSTPTQNPYKDSENGPRYWSSLIAAFRFFQNHKDDKLRSFLTFLCRRELPFKLLVDATFLGPPSSSVTTAAGLRGVGAVPSLCAVALVCMVEILELPPSFGGFCPFLEESEAFDIHTCLFSPIVLRPCCIPGKKR